MLLWRNLKTRPKADVSLNSAEIGTLVDDPASWPQGHLLQLDGFTYKRFAGAPTDAKTRLDWLEQGSNFRGTFYPHPYTQCARVLREMGHEAAARRILIERQKRLARTFRVARRVHGHNDFRSALRQIWSDTTHPFLWLGDFLFRLTAGYGYRPFNSVAVLIALIAALWYPARATWNEGSFAPNSGPVLVSDGWQSLAANPDIPNPAEKWSSPIENEPRPAGMDWESFSAFAWSIDTVIPIVEMGQTAAWAPSTERGWWGKQLYWLRWLFTGLGWIAASLGVAAVTGIIRKD